MSNLSYCMFENTESDLSDCLERLEEIDWDLSALSDSERKAAIRLFKICAIITENTEDGLNNPFG